MKTIFQFNKQLTALALLTVASVGGGMLVVANVSAQTKSSGVVKDVTIWEGNNRHGASFASNKGVADLSLVGFDNKASSIAVNNGQKWRFYQDKNFKGQFVEIGPDEFRGNIGRLNNQAGRVTTRPRK